MFSSLLHRIEKEEVRLTPVATAFDLRVVAAPAVVYRTVSLQGTKQVRQGPLTRGGGGGPLVTCQF